MQLADLQKSLAAGLAGPTQGDPAPEGLAGSAVERTRRALIAKRRQAAAHLLPRLRVALGPAWAERFEEHAEHYAPCGLLYHVDDAWQLAETVTRGLDLHLAIAAHDDLVFMRLRYARTRTSGAHRIQERRAPLVALVRIPIRHLIVRMPGTEGRVWTVRV
ncbi:MAG TPA: hypothetical protein VH988_34100 [Thermoanaerobaculia bacterium]|jgi:hypothetical protein|nr:hypothetical protein [Thermoanaerobaculia bacterium]